VVLDEPTNGLDPSQLIEARGLIREIAQDHAVLLSSHILTEIHALCNQIIMIEGGRIVFADTMDAFDNYSQPQTIIVRMENPPAPGEMLRIPGVRQADLVSDKVIRVVFDGDEEVAERIIAAGVHHRWQIRGISIEKGQLDEVFKQIANSR